MSKEKGQRKIILAHQNLIGLFGKYQFLLGLTMVPRENKNNAYVKFGGPNEEYYRIFQNSLFYLESLKINTVNQIIDNTW